MAWTEQDYQEIVARLMANSIGVNEVPNADKADDVTSLPALKPSGSNSEASVVNYPLEFLKGEQGEPGIQGEPGKSFKVAGEYATLEALKSAVPDGSAVDGFMAVGTEAPYDYYAWVSSAGGNNPDPSPDRRYLLLSDGTPLLLANEEPILLADNGERVASNGEWVNQGKIGGIDEAPTDGKAYGRKNGDWAEVPEHLNLTSENLNDINGAGFATQKSTADYTSPENNYPINENGALIFANANYGHSNQIYGSYLTNRWFARGGGNQQGVRTNWKEFAFTDDVLTKTNTSSFTPTGDYQPATKKYVDDKHILLTITNEAHQQLISNQEVKAGEAESKINLVFGSIDNFKNIIQRLLSDNILFLKITEKEIFKVSTSHTYCNPDNGAYELSFIYTYTSIADANNISLVTKRIFIALSSTATNFFVVKDILVSDNLTTLTKKTAAEYDAIGSKDANTAYCVTD
nr:MAG TPA: FIBRITIN T4, STRUCTURAL PROTEIN, CHAPERONE.85A [Caudoviricetes sp.]